MKGMFNLTYEYEKQAIAEGYTTVCGPNQGDTSTLDYDTSAVISGGTFIGTGAAGMAQTFSSAQQGVVAVRAGSQAEGTAILPPAGCSSKRGGNFSALVFGIWSCSSQQILDTKFSFSVT